MTPDDPQNDPTVSDPTSQPAGDPNVSEPPPVLEAMPGGEADNPMRAADPVLPQGEGLGTAAFAPAQPVSLPPPLPADQELVGKLIHLHDMEELWLRAKEAEKSIRETIYNLPIAASLFQKISQAQNVILTGKEHYGEADALISEVEHRIEFHKRMLTRSKRIGPQLLAFELFCLIMLGAGLVILNFFGPSTMLKSLGSPIDFGQLINSMFWGGLGGVVGALYALWTHIADQQDFDEQYSIWYITNPILGIALGGFIFLIIQAGFLSLTAGETTEGIKSATVIYVMAWISGFKQNVVYEIVRRILDVFQIQPSASKPAAKTEEKKPAG
jgi:hypothetical protein